MTDLTKWAELFPEGFEWEFEGRQVKLDANSMAWTLSLKDGNGFKGWRRIDTLEPDSITHQLIIESLIMRWVMEWLIKERGCQYLLEGLESGILAGAPILKALYEAIKAVMKSEVKE